MPGACDFHALMEDACFVSPEELMTSRGWRGGVAALPSLQRLEFLESLGSSLKVRLLHAPFLRGLRAPLKLPFHLVVSLVTPPPLGGWTKARREFVARLTVQH